jgi:ribosomal protein L35AE/L33A
LVDPITIDKPREGEEYFNKVKRTYRKNNSHEIVAGKIWKLKGQGELVYLRYFVRNNDTMEVAGVVSDLTYNSYKDSTKKVSIKAKNNIFPEN